jgi:hypothetical protein
LQQQRGASSSGTAFRTQTRTLPLMIFVVLNAIRSAAASGAASAA